MFVSGSCSRVLEQTQVIRQFTADGCLLVMYIDTLSICVYGLVIAANPPTRPCLVSGEGGVQQAGNSSLGSKGSRDSISRPSRGSISRRSFQMGASFVGSRSMAMQVRTTKALPEPLFRHMPVGHQVYIAETSTHDVLRFY